MRIVLIAAILVLAAAASAYLVFYRFGGSKNVAQAEARSIGPAAELVSAKGLVLAGKPHRKEWYQIVVGARLMEGDVIRTDQYGAAGIRYSSGKMIIIPGNTVMTVRIAGDGRMETAMPVSGSASVSADSEQDDLYSEPAGIENKAAVDAFNEAGANDPGPFIRLDRIVQFGRSLELVGNVEAGSRLTVNNEIVDVSGDGSFKHFTNPFPGSGQRVNLVMKVANLAGRRRMVTSVYDFNPRGREH